MENDREMGTETRQKKIKQENDRELLENSMGIPIETLEKQKGIPLGCVWIKASEKHFRTLPLSFLVT